MAHPPEVDPYRVGGQVTLGVHLHPGPYRDAVAELFADAMTGDDTLTLEGSSATEVWADYWAKKLAAQARAAARTEAGG